MCSWSVKLVTGGVYISTLVGDRVCYRLSETSALQITYRCNCDKVDRWETLAQEAGTAARKKKSCNDRAFCCSFCSLTLRLL